MLHFLWLYCGCGCKDCWIRISDTKKSIEFWQLNVEQWLKSIERESRHFQVLYYVFDTSFFRRILSKHLLLYLLIAFYFWWQFSNQLMQDLLRLNCIRFILNSFIADIEHLPSQISTIKKRTWFFREKKLFSFLVLFIFKCPCTHNELVRFHTRQNA